MRWRLWATGAALCWAMAVAAQTGDSGTAGAAGTPQALREQIRLQRQAIAEQKRQEEAACYQHFAVQDCLARARAQARQAGAPLRAQEMQLNEVERKDKALQRLQSLEERQKSAPALPQPGQVAVRGGAGPGGAIPNPRAAEQQRAQEARLRAEQRRAPSDRAAIPQRAAEREQRAAQARQRHAEQLQQAQAHREQARQAQAQDLAAGKKPAAPLPAP